MCRVHLLRRKPQRLFALSAMVLAITAIGWQSTQAAYTLDRRYQMGDGSVNIGGTNFTEDAANGAAVGSGLDDQIPGFMGTLDSINGNGSGGETDGDSEPLTAPTSDATPTYVEYGVGGNPAAPLPAAAAVNSFGHRYDGIDDYLQSVNLNDPSITPAGAPSGYAIYDTQDRGMQLWVYPNAVDGVAEYIIDDADEHGFNITVNGTFLSETREGRVNSTVAAPQDAWTHLMLVHDSAGADGALFYVNGLASVTHTSDYDSNNATNLLVGANAEDDPNNVGNTQSPNDQTPPTFFSGIIDDIEMFVIDDGTTLGAFDYTEDNGYFTDVFLANQPGYGFTLNSSTGHNSQSWVDGDINYDGNLDQLDVDAFVAGWLAETDDLPGSGPQIGDYTTLAQGDLDLDGDTDLADFIVLRQLGPSLSFPQLNSVPEPSAFCLATLLCGTLLAGRPRRKRNL